MDMSVYAAPCRMQTHKSLRSLAKQAGLGRAVRTRGAVGLAHTGDHIDTGRTDCDRPWVRLTIERS